MNQLRIRRMVDEDLDDTVEVWERSRWDAQRWLEERMGYDHHDNHQHFRDVVARDFDVWIACADAKVVGVLAMTVSEINQLYVEPMHQNQGVGSALIEHAKGLAPSGFTLYTHQRNQKARAFYENRGFRAVRFGTSPPPESEPDVMYAWNPVIDRDIV